MAITDKRMDATGASGTHVIDGSPATIATSQTGKRCFAWVAPFAGMVTYFQVYATTVVATLSFDLQNNGSTSMLTGQVTPSADAVVSGTLVSTPATLRFAKGDTISVKYTSGGSGAATNPSVIFGVRPYPMNQDAAL